MAIAPINNNGIINTNEDTNYQEDDALYFDQNTYEDIIDDIAYSEEDFIDIDKQNGQYYLGSAVYYPEYNSIQLDTAISPNTLFSYNLYDIKRYLAEYSVCNITQSLPDVHILQLNIRSDGEHCAIIKTFWLKIIQRSWKKQYSKKRAIMLSRGNIVAQRHFELTGTYPRELRYIPGLRGLLA